LRRRLRAGPLAKWAGYFDQYLLFPRQMRAAMHHDPADTLYVFCDQALGPWMPSAVHRPHVVHCHDLLALRSALGDIAVHPTGATGRLYQRYIRRGFRQARHFISISAQSRADLHAFGGVRPLTSEVVHNGLNHPYRPLSADEAQVRLRERGLAVDARRCLLHVGGGQWYKNAVGVVHLYAQYARGVLSSGGPVPPLWMVSPPPDAPLRDALASVPDGAEVRFLGGLDVDALEAAYAYALAFLFPSHAEGFGWPIVEAMACGCPVITTDAAPMREVGGEAASYLPRLQGVQEMAQWSRAGARLLARVLARTPAERDRARAAGLANAARFGADAAIERYLEIYRHILDIETRPRERRT